jgi:hypothetical protein
VNVSSFVSNFQWLSSKQKYLGLAPGKLKGVELELCLRAAVKKGMGSLCLTDTLAAEISFWLVIEIWTSCFPKYFVTSLCTFFLSISV